MGTERTLAIIKPDAVEAGNIGAVIAMIEAAGLKPVEIRMRRLSVDEARGFYRVHEGKPFYDELVKFMSVSPVVTMVLEEFSHAGRERVIDEKFHSVDASGRSRSLTAAAAN